MEDDLPPSTTKRDRSYKKDACEKCGIREYWIVDQPAKSMQVFVLEDGHYAAKDFGASEDKLKVNILEGCVIDLPQVFPE